MDEYVWKFVATICRKPELVQRALDAKIAILQAEQGQIEAESERLQAELDQLAEERQWVITTARKGRITDEDMDAQLSAIDLQIDDLRKKQSENMAALAVQQQSEYLKAWADQYLKNVGAGLRVLETDVLNLTEPERAALYDMLGASRFEQKYNGDSLAALRWAVLQEKRRTVRTLISQVLVIKADNGQKKVIPQLAFDVPPEFISLVYDHQSLAYRPEWVDEKFGGRLKLDVKAGEEGED